MMGGRGSGPTPRYAPEQIASALRTAEGKPRVAAKLLGCHRATIWRYQQRLPQEDEDGLSDEQKERA